MGVAAFRGGGFIVDGGHRFGGPGGKAGFAPSAISRNFAPGPVLFRHPFPAAWRVLVAVPKGATIHADDECRLFEVLCPLPAAEVGQLARIILMQIMPAIVESDLEVFGRGIEDVQELGFKKHEVAMQTAWVSTVKAEMRRVGLFGVGMSSWGPALYGFGDAPSVEKARVHLARFMSEGEGGITFATEANNVGASITSE